MLQYSNMSMIKDTISMNPFCNKREVNLGRGLGNSLIEYSVSILCRPLQSRADYIFRGLCELFDAYLLSCFLVFSTVSFEELVCNQGAVSQKLRSVLLKILTEGVGCNYKAQVKETF